MSNEVLKSRNTVWSNGVPYWRYYRDHYESGPDYAAKLDPLALSALGLGGASVRYVRSWPLERVEDYLRRLSLSCAINVTAPVVDFYTASIGRAENIVLDLPEAFAPVVDDFDGFGQDLRAAMSSIRRSAMIAGLTFAVVDAPSFEGVVSEADRRVKGLKPYVYEVRREDMLDWRLDQRGKIREALFRVRADEDGSIGGSVDENERWRFILITPLEIQQWTARHDGDGAEFLRRDPNLIKEVPIVPVYHRREGPMRGQSLLRGGAKIQQAVCNWYSSMGSAIENQMFAIPVLTSRQKPTDVGVGVSTVLHLNPDDQETFGFASPPTAPFEAVLSMIYRSIALANKHLGMAPTAISEAGPSEQSGASKAWDYREAVEIMSEHAQGEQESLKQVLYYVGKFLGVRDGWLDRARVEYVTQYDMNTIDDQVARVIQAQAAGLPESAMREMRRGLVVKLMPSLGVDMMTKINEELEHGPHLPDSSEGAADRDKGDDGDGDDQGGGK